MDSLFPPVVLWQVLCPVQQNISIQFTVITYDQDFSTALQEIFV